MRWLVERLPSPVTAVRILLVAFVLTWLFGPYVLRSTVPIWLAFVVAAGLEVHFFLEAITGAPSRRPDRGPQDVDRERYGYDREADELLLVREGSDELWIPYAGETGEDLEALTAEARAGRELGEDEAGSEEQEALSGPEPRYREYRHAVRRLAGGLAVIGALALVLWAVDRNTGWRNLDEDTRVAAEARFSDEASLIAGKPVRIECDESGRNVGVVQHADGVAVVGGDLAYLTPQRCLDLYRLAYKGEVSSSQTARALAVLAHEAWHLRGEGDEGTTECYALQSAVELGQRLGLSQATAEQMMRQQLVENVDRGEANAEYLVPGDCRDGGPLDLKPETHHFP